MLSHHLPLSKAQLDQIEQASLLLPNKHQRESFAVSVRNRVNDGDGTVTNQALRRCIRFCLSAYGVSTRYLNLTGEIRP
jgi:hypothetical protein